MERVLKTNDVSVADRVKQWIPFIQKISNMLKISQMVYETRKRLRMSFIIKGCQLKNNHVFTSNKKILYKRDFDDEQD